VRKRSERHTEFQAEHPFVESLAPGGSRAAEKIKSL